MSNFYYTIVTEQFRTEYFAIHTSLIRESKDVYQSFQDCQAQKVEKACVFFTRIFSRYPYLLLYNLCSFGWRRCWVIVTACEQQESLSAVSAIHENHQQEKKKGLNNLSLTFVCLPFGQSWYRRDFRQIKLLPLEEVLICSLFNLIFSSIPCLLWMLSSCHHPLQAETEEVLLFQIMNQFWLELEVSSHQELFPQSLICQQQWMM